MVSSTDDGLFGGFSSHQRRGDGVSSVEEEEEAQGGIWSIKYASEIMAASKFMLELVILNFFLFLTI